MGRMDTYCCLQFLFAVFMLFNQLHVSIPAFHFNNNNLFYITYNVVFESQLRKDFVPPLKKLGAFVITDHSNDTVKVSFKK